MRASPKKLSMVASMRLMNLIETEYANKRVTDAEFAVYASEKLGVEILRDHVQSRRDELRIPASNRGTAGLLISQERIESLERQVLAHEKEARGLAAIILEMRDRLRLIEHALRLKGHFEGFQ